MPPVTPQSYRVLRRNPRDRRPGPTAEITPRTGGRHQRRSRRKYREQVVLCTGGLLGIALAGFILQSSASPVLAGLATASPGGGATAPQGDRTDAPVPTAPPALRDTPAPQSSGPGDRLAAAPASAMRPELLTK
jgi:hypothetical protein